MQDAQVIFPMLKSDTMKTRKEVIQGYLEAAEETLLKIQIRMDYVNARYAADSKQSFLQDLAQLTADQKETEVWINYLKAEAAK
jgi:hypothetical protein